MAKLSDARKGQLSDQLAELYRVTSSGQRNYEQVRRAVQDAIEGKFPDPTPVLLPPPDDIVDRVCRQLDRYLAIGFDVSGDRRRQILEQARAFEPLTMFDRPLVTGMFGYESDAVMNEAWQYVSVPGLANTRYFGLQQRVWLVGRKSAHIYPRLVHFNPNAYPRYCSSTALQMSKEDGVRLAGGEVIEMLVAEPEWALEWDGKFYPYPLLSSLRVMGRFDTVAVPCVKKTSPYLYLSAIGENRVFQGFASATIREC